MGGHTLAPLALVVLFVTIAAPGLAHDPPGACLEGVCVRLVDEDHDHTPDGLIVATSNEATAANVHAHDDRSTFYVEAVGPDHHEGYGVFLWGDTQHDASAATPQLRSGNASVAFIEFDHDQLTYLYWAWLTLHDHDEDGFADEPHLEQGGTLIE